MAEQQPVIIDDQMAISRGNVYVPLSQGVVIVSENRGQWAGSVKNFIENRTALTCQMHCDKDCRREIVGKIFGKKRQRFDATRRRADGQDVSIGHKQAVPCDTCDNVSGSTQVPEWNCLCSGQNLLWSV
jgi:hypothetical protein